jgi:NADPH-dependent glutamate synthase beta subunit-like oxidoreductase
MLRLGIPEYRLPRELVRMEINLILGLGVDLKLNQRMGQDFSLKDLRQGFDAVFLAIGAHKSRDLRIEGVELDGVLRGVDFLLNVNMGYKVELGERVVVIGGGNVALDVARTVARQEPPISLTAARMVEALDVARMAVRFGAREVHVVSLESREEMPADPLEVEEAEKERVVIHPRRGPARITGEAGRVTGLETLDVASVFDEAGRFNPKFLHGTERVLPADSIIMAIGQASDLSFLSPEDGLAVTGRGTIQVDRDTLATSAPGVYAGGDVAFGPRIAVDAVADGKRAARAIDAHLRGGEGHRGEVFQITVHDSSAYRQTEGFEQVPRQPVPSLPIDRRIGVAQVELGYDEATALQEARRCLRCWINTVFEGTEERGSECILCGGCADVCPEDCIELVAGERAAAVGATEILPAGVTATLIIKDETACIRCGLCARRCPVGCIAMEGFESAEVIAV